MKLLRRTTPVALVVGSAVGVLIASFQAVDAIFSNPGIVTSAGTLLGFLARAYFLYILSCLILLFLINLALCVIMPRRMREADYPRLVEYYTGVVLFLFILFIYMWKDKTTIGEMFRHRVGVLSQSFLILQVLVVSGFVAFILAGAIHQLTKRLPPGRLALYISSLAWFMLLFPYTGETVLYAGAMHWHPVIQVVILIIIAFILSFIIKLLNRLTHSLIALNRKTWIGFASLAVVCLLVWGTIAFMQPKSSNPLRSGDEINVVLLSIDALRADHVGCYGYQPPIPRIAEGEFTPNIDKFAAQGMLFERAYSTSPWTLASIASWMTGGWPVESGGTHVNHSVYKAMTMLPEALSEEGYISAAFNTNPFLSPRTQIGRGFSEYWEFFEASNYDTGLLVDDLRFLLENKLDTYGLRETVRSIANKQVNGAFNWLDDHKDEKFFLWVHLYDPHYPYTPPSPYKEDIPDMGGERRVAQYCSLSNWRMGSEHHRYNLRRHIVNLYDGEIRFSDEITGKILAKLDELGLSEDTLVIVVSDHGEEFFEHGSLEHGHSVYEEVLHVPLIFRLPGRIPAGERVPDRVSLIDLFPTLLDFTGATVEPKIYRGESLKDAIVAGDMSLAGPGRMNLTPWVGGGPDSGNLPEEDISFDRFINEEFPSWEFQDGARFSEPGLFTTGNAEKSEDTPEGAVEDAASLLMSMAGSRLSSGRNEWEGFVVPEGRVIFAEDLFYYDYGLKSITIGDWKLIHSINRFHDPYLLSGADPSDEMASYGLPNFVEGDELYNLADDPREMKNIIYEHPEMARYLFWRLKEIDYFDRREAKVRQEIEGAGTYFGAGLKNLTKGFGYW